MQSLDHRLWFSPSDLSQYLGCEHATRLSLEVARGTRPKIHATSAYATMIFKKGDDHEAAHLAHLRASGRDVVEVGASADIAAGARRTEALMRSGTDVIYQAPLVIDGWRGVADFLERVEGTTALGSWGYEAVDTKLARVEALPSHVLQLCFYSEGIERIQGESPRLAHVELGSGLRESIRLREVAAYFRRARAGFTTAIAADAPTEPFRCDHCDFCAFKRVCEERWRAEDSLVRVAGLRRDQIGRLRGAGVGTLTRLGSLAPDVAVPDISRPTLTGLVQQARLQHEGEQAGTMPFELLELEVGRGFARLPEPSPGDVMFDLEGDPFWTPARELTFLFGMLVRNGERWDYVPFWGHTPEQERRAFERAIDLVTQRLVRWPQLHVFHYSAAEPSAIRQLMATHATRELEVDDLLRRGVFVDLLAVVKQALRVGVESYTLKQIEKLAGFERTAALASGSDAVLAYERWQTTRDQRELSAIAAYNEEDCRATGALYDWLLGVRPAAATWPAPPVIEPIAEEARAAQREREQLRGELIEGQEAGSERWLAGELLSYHRREARPAWWRYFALRGLDDDALLADGEALTGLEPDGPRVAIGRSEDIRLRFPSQQHKIGAGAYEDENDKTVKVVSVDDAAGMVTIRRGLKRSDEPTPRTLLPGGPFDTGAQQDALLRFAQSIRDEDDRFAALKALVRRDLPRIAGLPPGAPIQTTDLGEQQRLARALERSTLVVQGPPGTGKTHTGARLIVDLIRAGARVGVTALSHNAINNLVDEIELAADEADLWFVGARKTSAGDKGAVTAGPNRRVLNVAGTAGCLSDQHRLVAATTWLFADERSEDAFDYLVIDEAGQLSLADAVAAGTSARNLILLGDPLQLPQVSQAIHPTGTNASVLEHVLGTHATIPPERGIFLDQSWRMHPAICEFISAEVYDERLHSHPGCARQTTVAGEGIRYLPTPHAGNASASREEAAQISDTITTLLSTPYTGFDGSVRALVADDFVVVAPYNAQVRLLRGALPDGVRVGTVDRFQGQEAPVVFFSMASSSSDLVPRNLAFLFSRNRLNVAISRARCLAYLVCSPTLLEARAKTIEEMRLISTLCSVVETAAGADRRQPPRADRYAGAPTASVG